MNHCEQSQQNGEDCIYTATMMISRTDTYEQEKSASLHHVCDVHFTRMVRDLMAFESPITLKVWSRS